MTSMPAAPYLPIIYVRGYAATMAEIDAATADPYMGFNLGSSMLRQDAAKQPVRFIFESPLLRLMKDHGYVDAFRHGDDDYDPGTAPDRSIWVFRYYERASSTLGDAKRVAIEDFAVDLRRFILKVRAAICGDDAGARAGFKAYLVAHSMGGLVCRCYLQNICRHGAGSKDANAGLELTSTGGEPLVDKLYTYGTPHNGIDFAGLNAPNLGGLDALQIANFNRDRMREYLRTTAGVAVNDLDGAFPPERAFCFMGSNHADYAAFLGLSRRAAGAMSDGLVMLENAYVRDAPRAVAYRSHSGPHGIVNSEAGYQNLRRFLFGEWRITATLEVDDLPLAKPVQERKDAGAEIRGSYYFDIAALVRGAANYQLNECRFSQQSAILKTYDELTHEHRPVYLFTGYLLEQARAAPDRALMFLFDVGIRAPAFEVDRKFWFDQHFEGFLYQETITFALRTDTIRYGLASAHGLGEAPAKADVTTEDGTRIVRIPLGTPPAARPGFSGALRLSVEPWEVRNDA